MRSPEEVFQDFAGRRRGIIKALITDVDKFYAQCDPSRENLTLFAFPDGTWAVDLPAEEVPPEVPEPALGINFARDGMSRKDWLCLVAVHSDSWLLALAFYKGARFNKEQRQDLFELINQLPTCYEVVSGRAGANRGQPGGQKRGPPGRGGNRRMAMDDEGGPGDDWEDGEGDPCPMCGRLYSQNEFWIACDYCDVWYCGRCAKMTAARAERVKNWKCGQCGGNP